MTDVKTILDQVRERGRDAVLALTERFDGVRLAAEQLVYDPAEVDAEEPTAAVREAIDTAIRRVRAFHRQTRPTSTETLTAEAGLALGERWIPIRRVGVYAPNGQYPLISSLLMTAIPAQEAGADQIVVAISPRHHSRTHPAWHYALSRLGLHEVLAAGGAQAVAALAYGLEGLKPVDLVAGPGNRYVTAAKRQLFSQGVVGIDLIAGPSEVLIVADGTANPRWIALDLLSQAEHAADGSAVLVSWDPACLTAVEAEVEFYRRADPSRVIGRIAYQAVDTPQAALALLNQSAPEHAGLVGETAEALAPGVRTAGALFVGAMAGQALGDYLAGPSHVLPTGGSGRFLSGLSTRTFMRRMSVIRANADLAPNLLRHGAALADLEGLSFHRQALSERLGDPDGEEGGYEPNG